MWIEYKGDGIVGRPGSDGSRYRTKQSGLIMEINHFDRLEVRASNLIIMIVPRTKNIGFQVATKTGVMRFIVHLSKWMKTL